jgi:hypothetical protein
MSCEAARIVRARARARIIFAVSHVRQLPEGLQGQRPA